MPMPSDLLVLGLKSPGFDISALESNFLLLFFFFFGFVSEANQSVFKGLKLISGCLFSVVPPKDSCICILSLW